MNPSKPDSFYPQIGSLTSEDAVMGRTERARRALRECTLFQGLDPAAMSTVFEISQPWLAYRGQTLMEEGETGEDLLLIVKGNVGVRVESIAPLMEIPIARLGAGEVIGEMILAGDALRTATVVALEPCEVVSLSGQRLRTMMDADPRTGYRLMGNLAAILAQRVNKTNHRLTALARATRFLEVEG